MSVIRLNQVGYMESLPKNVILLSKEQVDLKDADNNVIRRYKGGELAFDEASGDYVRSIELGTLHSGSYKICCDGEERKVNIGKNTYRGALNLMVRSFYLQRCGCELKEEFAGVYQHAACHFKKAFLYEQPEKSIDVSGGWHDAGDFGKYTGPAASAIGHMLYAYRFFSASFADSLHIPESGNGVPDVLNECRYELEWLLKMQREDGGIYHKVSTKNFAPFIMPQDDLEPEYVLPASHCATGAVSACFALASEVWSELDPEFSEKLKNAAVNAWNWLEMNPEFKPYMNPEDIHTGMYGDRTDKDEILWAATELYALTGEKKYLEKMAKLFDELPYITAFGWNDVSGFATMKCVLELQDKIPHSTYENLKNRLFKAADNIANACRMSGYGTDITKDGYIWGSTMSIMNGACVLISAYLCEKNAVYLENVLNQINYLFGMNAVDTCFVTGIGEKPFMNPHHRACASDGIEDPIPGFVSGGPNNKWCYPQTREKLGNETAPAKYYLDETFSADTNEVAIYWNSIAVFVCAFFDSLSAL